MWSFDEMGWSFPCSFQSWKPQPVQCCEMLWASVPDTNGRDYEIWRQHTTTTSEATSRRQSCKNHVWNQSGNSGLKNIRPSHSHTVIPLKCFAWSSVTKWSNYHEPKPIHSLPLLCLLICLVYLGLWMVGHGNRIPSDSHCRRSWKTKECWTRKEREHVFTIFNLMWTFIFKLRTCLYRLCQCLGLHKMIWQVAI